MPGDAGPPSSRTGLPTVASTTDTRNVPARSGYDPSGQPWAGTATRRSAVRRAPIALALALTALLAVPSTATATKNASSPYRVRPATYGVATTYDVPVK